jgi:hypothetical protein
MSCGGGHLGFQIHIKNKNLGSVSSLVSEKRMFEISANQSILLALAAMLNIRLERKTETFANLIASWNY